jgi:hypothetical protein
MIGKLFLVYNVWFRLDPEAAAFMPFTIAPGGGLLNRMAYGEIVGLKKPAPSLAPTFGE